MNNFIKCTIYIYETESSKDSRENVKNLMALRRRVFTGISVRRPIKIILNKFLIKNSLKSKHHDEACVFYATGATGRWSPVAW